MWHPLGGEPLFVTYFDASLRKTAAMNAQQAEIHFVAAKPTESRSSKAGGQLVRISQWKSAKGSSFELS